MNITYRQLSGVKSVRASKDLSRMANYHLLEAKKHSNQTYYVVGKELKARIKKINPPTLDVNPPTQEVLSTDLKNRIERIGRRTRDKELLLGIVVDLCQIKSRSISKIAKTINRTDNYVKHDLVAPLRENGRLTYTIPDIINHPEQKYKVVEKQ